MPTTHTTIKGDTLWDLAKKYLGSGSRWKEISGYTGKPEDMPEGIVLTMPGQVTPSVGMASSGDESSHAGQIGAWMKPGSPGQEYSGPWKPGFVPYAPSKEVEEIGYQLGAGSTPTGVGAQPTIESVKEKIGGIEAGVGTLQTELERMKSEEAGVSGGETSQGGTGAISGDGGELGDFATIYEDEYGKSGMEEVKTSIATLDTDITDRKTTRDKLMLDENGKPIPQWMITGRIKMEVDAAKIDLNQLIDQRNDLADQYNAGIADVERKTKYAIDYQREMTRQLEFGKGLEIEERMMKLREEEAAKPPTPTEYAPTTAMKEWEAAGKPVPLEEWLAKGDETDIDQYTPTQLRARTRGGELLLDAISKYQSEWPKAGDKGLGTREEFIHMAIEKYPSLTPQEIKDAVYGIITNEWLSSNEKTGFWQTFKGAMATPLFK